MVRVGVGGISHQFAIGSRVFTPTRLLIYSARFTYYTHMSAKSGSAVLCERAHKCMNDMSVSVDYTSTHYTKNENRSYTL